MKRNLVSTILILTTIVLAVVFYIIIFNHYDKIWFNFVAIFYLCLITFVAAVGIFIAAILVEPKDKQIK